MASEVCKAYIRGALVTNWFWNKLLGHLHPWNQRWCLQLWVNNHAKCLVSFLLVWGIQRTSGRANAAVRTGLKPCTFLSHLQMQGTTGLGGGCQPQPPARGNCSLLCPHPRVWAPLAAGMSPSSTADPARLPPKQGGVVWVRSLGPSLLLSNQWNQTLPVPISILGC